MTDTARCGAKHPKNREVCTRDAGHVGLHSNGGNVVWKHRPEEKQGPRPTADAFAPMPQQTTADRVFSMIAAKPGQTAPQIGRRYSKAIAELEAAGRIEWRDDGWWPAEQQAKPAPMTLEDEPEDPEADAAAIAVMDAQDEDDDPYEDEIRSDEDRALARRLREDREAHAAELDAEEPAAPAAPAQGGTVFRGVMVGMRRRDIKVHPAADAFPMIDGPEFEALVEDISKHGVRRKPVLDADGNLVDGRNRMRACERLGIDPEFEHLPEGVDIVDYVVSTNVHRRHLNESQRAMIAARLADAPRGRPSKTGHSGLISQEEAAQRMQVSDRTVRRAKAVAAKAVPEVVQAVDAGKVDVSAAAELAKLPPKKQRELVEKVIAPSKGPVRGGKIRSLAKQEEKRETVRKINTGRVAPMPAGQFGVIYADYPWLYDNSDQHEGSRGHMGYPPMEMDQIIAHAREAATRAGKDCIIALWVTNLHIPNIGRVVEAYGAAHHTMVTWPKPRAGVGSWPRGQTEHLVIASIGAPVHTLNEISTLLPSWQPARPGEHSSKPAEVAELLAKHCGGPFLELFARDEEREGWTLWGAEVGKFATTEAA